MLIKLIVKLPTLNVLSSFYGFFLHIRLNITESSLVKYLFKIYNFLGFKVNEL